MNITRRAAMGFITTTCVLNPTKPFAKIARQAGAGRIGPNTFTRNWNDNTTAGAVYYTATAAAAAQQLSLTPTGGVGANFGRASFEATTRKATDVVLEVDLLFPGDATAFPGEGPGIWWRVTPTGLGGTPTLPDGYSALISTPLAGTKDFRLQRWPAGTILTSAAVVGYAYHVPAHVKVVMQGTTITCTLSGGGLAAPIVLGPIVDATYARGAFGMSTITSSGGVNVASVFDNYAATYYEDC